MITRSNRNTKNDNNKLTMVSRGLIATAAAALLTSTAYAQTNSSSGINRRAAEESAHAPASSRKATIAAAPVKPRAKTAARKASKVAAAPRTRQASSPRSVKITIRGDRNDIRQARQQGMQSLQNANAAVAAANAEKEAAAAEAQAAREAAANAPYSLQQPGSTYGYGFVPGFGDPIASYGYGNGLYGSTVTTQPVIIGATPYGSPTQTFPSFYTNYSPGIYSTYSSFGSINPFGF
jgi:hypothetical protein